MTASRASIEGSLRQARSTASWKTRQTLVVLQIGLCTLLLAGAALLVRTFEHLRAADPGFDRDHIVVFSAEPYVSGYSPAQTAQLTRALQQRIRAMPDVKNVATAAIAVMRGSGMKMTVAPTGQRTTRADFLNTSTNAISPEYFDTMGIRVLSGRALYATDASEKHPVNVVVNEAFVQRFFRGADPVGRTLGQGLERVVGIDFNVAGVVSDAKYRSLREPMTPTLYTVSRSSGTFQLIVRTRGRPESVIQPVRDALRFLDPALPFTEIRTLAEDADASTAAEQTTAEAASLFAAVAAILSAIGVYSLLAYAVTQRRREIGIRMALGARPGQVGSLLVRQALAMALFGIGMGLAAAAVIGPLLQPVLYGVQSSDIASRTSAAVLVLIVAALGTAIPTARAARVEPAAALRTDA